MSTTSSIPSELILNLHQQIEIAAPAKAVFESILEQLGPSFSTPDGKSLQMTLEPWPGGRWFRDLGNKSGHLWAHVQVIKPPTLIELTGPMFMSYPAINHIQYKLTEHDDATTLELTHRAIGEISAQHREGVGIGWGHLLKQIQARVTR